MILHRENRSGLRLPVLLRRHRCVSHRQCWLCQHAARRGRVWRSVSGGLNQATALKLSRPCLLSMHKVCACAAWDRAFFSSFLLSGRSRSEELWGLGAVSQVTESWLQPEGCLILHSLLCGTSIHFLFLVHRQKRKTSHIWDFPPCQVTKAQTRGEEWRVRKAGDVVLGSSEQHDPKQKAAVLPHFHCSGAKMPVGFVLSELVGLL